MARHPHHRSRRYGKGFTLIEVMVALAVVAMALPAMLTLVMSQLDGTVAIREKTLAFWVAENELTRIRMQQRHFENMSLPEEDKGTVSMGSMQWYWEMRREDTTMDNFYRIEILVYAGGPVNSSSSGKFALQYGKAQSCQQGAYGTIVRFPQ